MRLTKYVLLVLIGVSCTYDVNDPLPQPKVPMPTTTLEASFVETPPNKLNSNYWKTADYLILAPQNLVTEQVPTADGVFNVSGTYTGLPDFNDGKNPSISMKAAYDNDSLYILITWKDTLFNASKLNWFYDGPTDPRKPGSTAGWTSQKSDDAFYLSFDMTGGKRDVWNWSLALSEPLGFAIDMIEDNSVLTNDAGNRTYKRNSVGVDDRGGPMYEWNDEQQELNRGLGGFTILDPGYYLLQKKTFTGDMVNGDNVYQVKCALCHGTTADGKGTLNDTGIKLNEAGQFNRWTRAALDAYTPSSSHEGAIYYPTSDTDREDLFARLRAFSGIPGYYLENPSGSSSDVRSVSNVQLAKIDTYNTKGYSVLLARKLNTGSDDDIVFNVNQVYTFNLALSHNDELNRIGSINQQLTFKPGK